MKNLIKLNESDLRRIVNRVIKENEEDREDYGTMRGRFFDDDEGDEEWGKTDIGEEELQDLIEEARDFLEMTCGYDLHDLNLMSEYDIVEALYDEGNDELAEEIEDLLNQEGFADFDEPYDSIGGHSVNDLKRAFAKTKGRDKELGEGFISESATVSGVKIDASAGGLATSVSGNINKYSISVKCGKDVLGVFVPVYTGPISLTSIWGAKDGGIAGEDNTGKKFSIPFSKASSLASKMKNGDGSIKSEGEGTIASVNGKCYVTLTKK